MYRVNLDSKKAVFAAGFLLVILLFYNLAIEGKTLPNISVGEAAVGGKNREHASELISHEFNQFANSPIVFKASGNKVEANLADLGISLDADRTLNDIYNFGRSGNFGQDLKDRVLVIFLKKRFPAHYRVDFRRLAYFYDKGLSQLGRPPKDATIAQVDERLVITEAEDGRLVDRDALARALFDKVERLDGGEISFQLIDAEPRVNQDGAQKAFLKVQSLQKSKITFNYGYDFWRLTDDNLLNILRFYPVGRENGYAERFDLGSTTVTILDLRFGDTSSPVLNVVLDDKKLDSVLAQIAKSVDRPTTNATLKLAGGKVSEFRPARDGQKVDLALARELVLSRVSIDNLSTEANIMIPLPVEVTRARIDSSEINSFGIRELLGKGVSYYAGSIANRAYNVGLGALRVSGTLVAPGEVFSFNKTVGEVSAATGYRQAYIISGGRTVLDDGGGICQVSTTIFRAALDAGLPIVERTAHAYRVGYYEQRGFKPGLDATVWAPGVDFVFKNDTGHHVLVQALVDGASARLEVDIYGTGDGRRVEISTPVVSDVKPAPPDRYQDDPTLPKGTVKQVDFSAQGARAVFTRKVYKEDRLIGDDVFKSNFRPWQAVYLVGTGG